MDATPIGLLIARHRQEALRRRLGVRFTIPLTKWSEDVPQAYLLDRYMLPGGGAHRTWMYWRLAGQVFRARHARKGNARRARQCLRLLRSAMFADQKGDAYLASVEFTAARYEWLAIAEEPVRAAGAEAMVARERKRNSGRRAAAERWGNSTAQREERDNKIRRLATEGLTADELCTRFGLTARQIRNIRSRARK